MNTPKNLLIANPDQSIVLTPVEVIRRMFAYTDENGILIVPQWPCDDCEEQGYYICRMNWRKADAEEAVAVYESLYAKLENAGEKPCDAQTMLPYPDSGMEEIAYHEHYGENKPTPKERYYAIAGDEDNGLKNVPMDDPEAFREWHRRRGPFFRKGKSSTAYGVVVPNLNGNLTVELIPVTDDDAKSGWRFIVFADFSSYTILAANALCDAGYPIQVGEAEVFFRMLTGDDDVEIVPAWEPVSPFSIHLPPGAVGKAVAEKAIWKNDSYETKRDTVE